MNKPNFSSILDRPASEIERPKPLPPGTYLTILQGLPRYDKSAKKQTEFIEFKHKITQAGEDVDEDALKEAGGLEDKTVNNTFYLTEDAAWRLRKFLEDCGFDFSDGSVTLREAAEQSANSEVYITIGHEPSQDGQSVFARIKGTAAV